MSSIILLHAICAYTILILLLSRAFPVFVQGKWQEKNSVSYKMLVGVQHLGYSILVLSGLWLLWQRNFQIESWFYAKIILFLVVLSASAKAFKRRDDILLVQRRAGLVIAIFAYCCIFALLFFKLK